MFTQIKTLANYFTKNNITFLIALLGFIISLINFSYFFIIRKRKLTLCFGTYAVQRYRNNDILLIHYQFNNESQLPISITGIQVVVDGHRYYSDIRKHIAEEFEYKKDGKTVYNDITTTDILPINLNSLASCTGFLAFLVPQDTISKNEKSLTFRICTNRGKAIQKTFLLHEDVQLH